MCWTKLALRPKDGPSKYKIRERNEGIEEHSDYLLFGVCLPPAVALAKKGLKEPAESGLDTGEGATADFSKQQRLVSSAVPRGRVGTTKRMLRDDAQGSCHEKGTEIEVVHALT